MSGGEREAKGSLEGAQGARSPTPRMPREVEAFPTSVVGKRKDFHSYMNYGNPPPYSDPGPTAPYPPYPQQPGGPQAYPPSGPYPPGPPGPYPPPNAGYPYQGYTQYGWQGGPPPEAPKTTVYVVEDQRRDDTGQATCLTACWTALCCCCLWDMLT